MSTEIACQCGTGCGRRTWVRSVSLAHIYVYARCPRPSPPKGMIAQCQFFGSDFLAIKYKVPDDDELLEGAERLATLGYTRL
jgi:hypothetical protein